MTYNINIPIFGFDIGTESCYVCEPGKKGIGLRLIDGYTELPTYLNLSEEGRLFGFKAKKIQNQSINKTFYNLKRLIGKSYNEVVDNEELFYPIEKGPCGELLIRISSVDKEHLVTPTQLLAMILKKLKYSSDFAPRCIISCPNYFTDSQKRELINAAAIANLKVVQILPDLSAVAINYCLYDISEENRIIPHFVAFVNIGSTSTQCSILSYCPKEYSGRVYAVEFDKNLGGQNLDEALTNYFIDQHELKLDKNSKLLLRKHCEKLKMKMSNTNDEIAVEIMNLYEDKDFRSSISKKKFEEICKEYFDRIEIVLQRALKKFIYLKKKKVVPNVNIKVVQLTGGSCKIPIIHQKAENVFGINPTLNKNKEVVALGCTLRTLFYEPSPVIKSIFDFEDYQPYQINALYYQENASLSEKYPANALILRGSLIPSAQQFVINSYKLPMIYEFNYIDEHENIRPFSKFKVFSKENITFLQGRIFAQLRIDKNGLFKFSSATLEIVKEDGSILPKKKSKDIRNSLNFFELDIEIVWLKGYLDKNSIKELKVFESSFDESILCEKDELEFTLYDHVNRWQDKIKKEEFYKYLTVKSREKFFEELVENEKWLIDKSSKNESLNKKALFDRVISLNVYVHKIEKTIIDIKQKKKFCDDLDLVFTLAKKNQKNIKAFETTLDKLYSFNEEGFIAEKQEWIDEKLDEPQNDEYEEDPKYSYSVCQKKLDILKYFIINHKFS